MGGDHKCPLCAATFTRPQHVGRHLRAHTGDRPYECKECPLKFARSDLLSRHVNKAHPKPVDGDAAAAAAASKAGDQDKKPKRKSFSHAATDAKSGSLGGGSFGLAGPSSAAAAAGTGSATLQAQRMYPNHPLLQSQAQAHPAGQANAWQAHSLADYTAQLPGQSTFTLPLTNTALGGGGTASDAAAGTAFMPNYSGTTIPGALAPPFSSAPMPAADLGGAAGYSYAAHLPTFGLDFGPKKRACDQCNHSKVRCDFATPCNRCSHRSIACTYNKPQRSRSIAYPMSATASQTSLASPLTATINPAATLPASVAAAAGSSQSPQSIYSSPQHASASPLFTNPLAPAAAAQYGMRRNSIAVTPTAAQTTAMLQQQALAYGNSVFQGGAGMATTASAGRPPIPNPQWQTQTTVPSQLFDYGAAHMPTLTTTANTAAAAHPTFAPNATVPGTTPAPNPYAGLVQRTSGTSSGSSPRHALAATPALTNSTSPAGSDSTFDRRSSHASANAAASGTAPWNPVVAAGVDAALLPDGTFGLATAFTSSPPQPLADTSSQSFAPMSQAAAVDGMQWPAGVAAPERISTTGVHFRSPFGSDEDDVSGPDSSVASTYRDGSAAGDDKAEVALQHALQHRRRSSAGVWANAFNQMSLSDPATATAYALTDPAIASQVAQQIQHERSLAAAHSRRATQPGASGHSGLGAAGAALPPTTTAATAPDINAELLRMASLTDAKDLWKMYMADPLSGATPALDKQYELDPMSLATFGVGAAGNVPGLAAGNGGASATPRPGVGRRTLSKSNSMPDLTSPMSGQAFFSTYLTGTTPRPMEPAGSYVPTPQVAELAPAAARPPDDMDQWKLEIKQRGTHFSMAPGAKMARTSRGPGDSASPVDTTAVATAAASANTTATAGTMPPPHTAAARPALLQTLAPERMPSFGFSSSGAYDPQAGTGAPLSAFSKTPSRLSSAYASAAARPGNKRLASQTLVPDGQKKVSLDMYDGSGDYDDDGDGDDDDAGGGYDGASGAAGALDALGSADFDAAKLAAYYGATGVAGGAAAGTGAPMDGLAPGAGGYYSAWPPLSAQP